MDENFAYIRRFGGVRQREHMCVVAVHPAVRHQPKQVEAMAARRGQSFPQDATARKFAGSNRFVDPRQILINDSAGAQIEMAYFRVSHLSFRQTNVETAGAKFPAGIIAVKLVVKRRVSEQRGVSVLLAFFPTARVNSPAIANDENDRVRHIGRTLPTISKIDKQFFR